MMAFTSIAIFAMISISTTSAECQICECEAGSTWDNTCNEDKMRAVQGDDTKWMVTSWLLDPFNRDFGGHSYTAFNVWGIGYMRWEYKHYDLGFYMDNCVFAYGGSLCFNNPQMQRDTDISYVAHGTYIWDAVVNMPAPWNGRTCKCFATGGSPFATCEAIGDTELDQNCQERQ
ncbi:hypothetical protein HDU76_008179, partial [Blyttiomyces sp. JEL0837]